MDWRAASSIMRTAVWGGACQSSSTRCVGRRAGRCRVGFRGEGYGGVGVLGRGRVGMGAGLNCWCADAPHSPAAVHAAAPCPPARTSYESVGRALAETASRTCAHAGKNGVPAAAGADPASRARPRAAGAPRGRPATQPLQGRPPLPRRARQHPPRPARAPRRAVPAPSCVAAASSAAAPAAAASAAAARLQWGSPAARRRRQRGLPPIGLLPLPRSSIRGPRCPPACQWPPAPPSRLKGWGLPERRRRGARRQPSPSRAPQPRLRGGKDRRALGMEGHGTHRIQPRHPVPSTQPSPPAAPRSSALNRFAWRASSARIRRRARSPACGQAMYT